MIHILLRSTLLIAVTETVVKARELKRSHWDQTILHSTRTTSTKVSLSLLSYLWHYSTLTHSNSIHPAQKMFYVKN